MAVTLKPGVRVFAMTPQIVLAVLVAEGIWNEDGEDMVITSVSEGRHGHTSLHYIGAAVDLRTRDISGVNNKTEKLALALGEDYDVVQEDTHIHIEFQPRFIA